MSSLKSLIWIDREIPKEGEWLKVRYLLRSLQEDIDDKRSKLKFKVTLKIQSNLFRTASSRFKSSLVDLETLMPENKSADTGPEPQWGRGSNRAPDLDDALYACSTRTGFMICQDHARIPFFGAASGRGRSAPALVLSGSVVPRTMLA